GVVVFLFFTRRGRTEQRRSGMAATPFPPPATPTAPAASSETEADERAWWQRQTAPPTVEGGSGSSGGTGRSGGTGSYGVGGSGSAGAGGTSGGGPLAYGPGSTRPPEPRVSRSHLLSLTMAVIAIALGVLWILDDTIFANLPPAAYPATALAITSLGLIAGAWWGKSRLLILVGLVATLATGVTTAAGDGPFGEQIRRPLTAQALESSYEHGAGHFVLDLSDLTDPENLDGRTVEIDARVGQIELLVPRSMSVAIDAHVEHGDIVGLSGVESYENGEKSVSVPVDSTDMTAADVVFDIQLFAGEIRVESLL
ncbi:MAG: hypothetical protein ACR2GB_05275, partial [Nocardioidaceae bacterium]